MIAIVILNWNTKGFLKNLLPNVIANTPAHLGKVVVADNASTDGSIELMEGEFPQVQLIKLKKNHGFAGGYNKALEQVEADYFVLLNSDVEVTNNWLTPLYELMQARPDIAACMPKIKAYHKRDSFEYAGAAGGFIDKFGYPFCRGRIFGELEPDSGQYDDASEIFWATGACMFIRANMFRKMGGFDEDFFAHMEEIDLCWRLKNAGHKIYYQPNSVVYHIGGGTLGNQSPYKLYLNYRNNLWLLQKNLPHKIYLQTMLRRSLFDALAALSYLASFSFAEFGAVIKAYIQFFKHKKQFKGKRSAQNPPNQYPAGFKIYKQSIVLDFFLHKKKLFSDLNSNLF